MLFRLIDRLKLLSHSLSVRLLVLTGLWICILSVGSIYTINLGVDSAHGYETLSHVGRIRSGILRSNLLIDPRFTNMEFLDQLQRVSKHLEWLRRELPNEAISEPERFQYLFNAIEREWFETMHDTMIDAKIYAKPLTAEQLENILNNIIAFQDMVESNRTEDTIEIRRIQLALLVCTFVSFLIILWFLMQWVVKPTTELRNSLARLSRGDFSVRTKLENSIEFERISDDFNNMVGKHEALVNNLEAKVQQTTMAVEERNRNLSQLYALTYYLGKNQSVYEMCDEFTVRMIHYTGAAACAVFLVNEKSQHLDFAADIDLSEETIAFFNAIDLNYEDVGEFYDMQTGLRLTPENLNNSVFKKLYRDTNKYSTVYVFHMRTGGKTIGVYLLYYRNEVTLSARRNELYENFGTHLAVGISNSRLISRDRQVAVMQERNFLARGLHDSIAQSLSFLNLQVQLLESGLKTKDQKLIDDTVDLIRTGVQESYEDVRELLTNFRERLHQESFEEAVESAVRRFRLQTHMGAKLTLRGDGPQLSEQEKLQVIFILQEALANVRKHSEATEVSIFVDNRDAFTINVMDNGVGIDPGIVEERKGTHFGLTIMKERADRIGATVKFMNCDPKVYPQGTQVQIVIPAHRHLRVH